MALILFSLPSHLLVVAVAAQVMALIHLRLVKQVVLVAAAGFLIPLVVLAIRHPLLHRKVAMVAQVVLAQVVVVVVVVVQVLLELRVRLKRAVMAVTEQRHLFLVQALHMAVVAVAQVVLSQELVGLEAVVLAEHQIRD